MRLKTPGSHKPCALPQKLKLSIRTVPGKLKVARGSREGQAFIA